MLVGLPDSSAGATFGKSGRSAEQIDYLPFRKRNLTINKLGAVMNVALSVCAVVACAWSGVLCTRRSIHNVASSALGHAVRQDRHKSAAS